MIQTNRDSVFFTVEVKVPVEQARDFAETMTGNDDDVLLAAETAMRQVVAGDPRHLDQIELDYTLDNDSEAVRSVLERAR